MSVAVRIVVVVFFFALSSFISEHWTKRRGTPSSSSSSIFASAQPEAARLAFDDDKVKSLITTDDDLSGTGRALLKITPNNNKVQKSNFGDSSFSLKNDGDKNIAACFIDVRSSVFPDIVFDDDGTGGDLAFKPLTYSNGGSVGAVSIDEYPWLWLPARRAGENGFDPKASFDPDDLSDVNNLFVDDVSNTKKPSPKAGGGYRGQLMLFTNLTPGKTAKCGGDMDPNSVAGLSKPSIDRESNEVGNNDDFDVGGVSGAEMSNGMVTVLFEDGTYASGTIAHDGSQAGGIAYVRNNPKSPPDLTVDGISPGGHGRYQKNPRPNVVVSSDPGDTVRVTMVKALNPTGGKSYKVAGGDITVNKLVEARLEAQYPNFPVNNAVEWQYVDVEIPSSGTKNVPSSSFNYDKITKPSDAKSPFDGHDELPLAFMAVIIDGNKRPTSDTTDPIRLLYGDPSSFPPPPPPPPPPPTPSPTEKEETPSPTLMPTEATASPTPSPTEETPSPTETTAVPPTPSPMEGMTASPTSSPITTETYSCVPGFLGINGTASSSWLSQGDVYENEEFDVHIRQEDDGNLVVRAGAPDQPGLLIWESGYSGPIGNYFTQLGANANLVTYRGTPPSNITDIVWETGTSVVGMTDDEDDETLFFGIDCTGSQVGVYRQSFASGGGGGGGGGNATVLTLWQSSSSEGTPPLPTDAPMNVPASPSPTESTIFPPPSSLSEEEQQSASPALGSTGANAIEGPTSSSLPSPPFGFRKLDCCSSFGVLVVGLLLLFL